MRIAFVPEIRRNCEIPICLCNGTFRSAPNWLLVESAPSMSHTGKSVSSLGFRR